MKSYTCYTLVIIVLLWLHLKDCVGEFCSYNDGQSGQYCEHGCCMYTDSICCDETNLAERLVSGVVSALIVILVILLAICYCRRRRDRRNRNRPICNSNSRSNTIQTVSGQCGVTYPPSYPDTRPPITRPHLGRPSPRSLSNPPHPDIPSPPPLTSPHPAEPPPPYETVMAQDRQTFAKSTPGKTFKVRV
ncbi:hypothetical protein SNE40_017887 [Patella caerulea]|uniref:Uncharacterized protein n=1 Tax=Patella caerulea TaxID=87958 RepID=A0AAN8JFA5_PATCE